MRVGQSAVAAASISVDYSQHISAGLPFYPVKIPWRQWLHQALFERQRKSRHLNPSLCEFAFGGEASVYISLGNAVRQRGKYQAGMSDLTTSLMSGSFHTSFSWPAKSI
mmetsp:Transcript_11538/g.31964  ORF Transcript_11538/g.31964 Transcript_11538/m.31964 type:complete len:109 (+) Transcript_11538:1675-2001(+)